MSKISTKTMQQRKKLRKYCTGNLKKFLAETTLHALKYVGDDTISIWERLFFLCSFIAALVTTANLISNIYAKWNNTPVIIGISPHPTSIFEVPFPAVTVCNMNQALLSKVSNYSDDSPERVLLNTLCFAQAEHEDDYQYTTGIQNNNLNIADFIKEHAQPCSQMLLSCQISSVPQNCTELFEEVLTDEGLCCVFNVVHPSFLYKGSYALRNGGRNDGRTPVDWSLETGYQAKLPSYFYPRTASGTGVSMGLSLILQANVDNYYCSTTNGPGFKVLLHNPVESPDIKEAGLTIPIGFETRFRIAAIRSEAVFSIRSIHRNSRQCLFNDEAQLLYYKYYTRRNCERECEALLLHAVCRCIPFNLPLVYPNASICNVRDTFCVNRSGQERVNLNYELCRKRCLPSCFDLSYLPDSFSSPLAVRNYTIPSTLLLEMPKDIVKNNIAMVHIYYQESVFHGDLKNVYIGLTEFLSNTGGIMGLFMGFSIISVVEIVYFVFMRPLFEYVRQKKKSKLELQKKKNAFAPNYKNSKQMVFNSESGLSNLNEKREDNLYAFNL